MQDSVLFVLKVRLALKVHNELRIWFFKIEISFYFENKIIFLFWNSDSVLFLNQDWPSWIIHIYCKHLVSIFFPIEKMSRSL